MSGHQRLYLSLVIACFTACVPYTPGDRMIPAAVTVTASYCPGGNGWDDPQNPIVCINNDTLEVRPDTIRVHNHKVGNPNAKIAINWFTKTGGGDLEIMMNQKGCVTDVSCPSRGHCRGLVDVNGVGNQCKYTVTLDGRPKDPTVIVEPCCM